MVQIKTIIRPKAGAARTTTVTTPTGGHGGRAERAEFAELAEHAKRAGTADTAGYAREAGEANHAVTADQANEAEHALAADKATVADSATRAERADMAEDLAPDSPVNERFLSRSKADTATGHITFAGGLTSAQVAKLLKGFETLDFAEGILGRGARVDKYGRAELESLFVRSFLEVPELRYNRIEIVQGERWNSFGGGIVESVNEYALTLQLKLEAGERPSLKANDLCKGIYNTGAGFSTCYFRIASVAADGRVTYALRPGTSQHPTPAMHFVAFGNTTDKGRQASSYCTTAYTRYLRGVNDWEITADNIAMQLGDLSNLSVYGLQLEGYSAYLNNVYFTGLIAQIGQAVADKMPRINPATGTWMQWDEQAAQMVDSGVKAKGEQGAPGADGRPGIDWGAAKMLYRDPLFKTGTNDLRAYNNLANGMLSLERVAVQGGHPTSSTHMMRVTVTGATTPGWGGVFFGVVPKYTHVYIVRLLAKVPVGYSLRNPGTRLGSGGHHDWLTTQEGTGGWQEYIYKLTCGDSGVMDSSFYIYLVGGASPSAAAPLVWHIASATVYDMTDMEDDLKAYVDGAFADGMIDAAEARAIAKYTNIVETERAALEATYAKVYANPLLVGTPKTNLLNTNTTYKGAADNLLASIRTAIADGRTTATQKADVDRKFAAYKSALTSLRVALEAGERAAAEAATQDAMDLAKYNGQGKMLYTDPMFKTGINDLYVYPGTDVNQGVTTLERVPTGEGNPYPSTHMLKITCRGRLIRDWGGFNFARYGTPTYANRILVTRIVAKIPQGRRIVFATNALGDDNSHRWLTPNQGTGKWEEYVYYVFAGTSGRFNSTNYFYLMGGDAPTADNPLVWYVAFATVYDATDLDDVQPTHLLPMPHDPTVTYVGGRNYAAVVYDTNNQWYKAIKDVPAGTPLSNRTYWQPISSMGAVGIGEAYIRSLWANKAFVKELHAQSLMARSIKAGDNPNNPQAMIDEHGYGYLSGGALRFDRQGLHMGAFDITDGNIAIKDELGEERVAYSLGKIPALADISSRGQFSGSAALEGWWMTASQFWSQGRYDDRNYEYVCTVRGWSTGKVSVGKDGADLRIASRLSASSLILTGGGIQIKLSTDKQNIAGSGYSNPSNFTEFEDITFGDCVIRNLPKGDYYIHVEVNANFIADSAPVTRQFHISFPTIAWSLDAANFRKVAYHPDGWYISYPDLLVYMSPREGFHLTGNANLPGVLCAARVNGYRSAEYKWGRFVNKKGTQIVQVDRESSGAYRVYHSIGHTNYIPTVTPQGGGALMVEMLDVYNDYFTFKFYNRNGVVSASAFNYQCIGANN